MLSTAFIYSGLLRCVRPHVQALGLYFGSIYWASLETRLAETADDGQGGKAGYGKMNKL